jgi:hypothetical protein
MKNLTVSDTFTKGDETYVVEVTTVDSPDRPRGWWPALKLQIWKQDPNEGLQLLLHGTFKSPALNSNTYDSTVVERTCVKCRASVDDMLEWHNIVGSRLHDLLEEEIPKELGLLATFVGIYSYPAAVKLQDWLSRAN